MNKGKNILKCSLYFLGIFILYVLIMSVFNYFSLIDGIIFKIINFIMVGILMFSSGFYIATKSNSKGYKAGLFMGLVNMIILFIISIVLRSKITTSFLLYFLILLLASTIGGMAGINFNTKKEL